MLYIFVHVDDVLVRMMDDKSAVDCRNLLGHGGPVYSTTISNDRNYLLSCSEDATSECYSVYCNCKKKVNLVYTFYLSHYRRDLLRLTVYGIK